MNAKSINTVNKALRLLERAQKEASAGQLDKAMQTLVDALEWAKVLAIDNDQRIQEAGRNIGAAVRRGAVKVATVGISKSFRRHGRPGARPS
jgi:hypothetical protein